MNEYSVTLTQTFILAGLIIAFAAAGLVGFALWVLFRSPTVAVCGGQLAFLASIHAVFWD